MNKSTRIDETLSRLAWRRWVGFENDWRRVSGFHCISNGDWFSTSPSVWNNPAIGRAVTKSRFQEQIYHIAWFIVARNDRYSPNWPFQRAKLHRAARETGTAWLPTKVETSASLLVWSQSRSPTPAYISTSKIHQGCWYTPITRLISYL